MSPVDTSLYEKLGVNHDATPHDLKVAYRKNARQLHPDKGGDPERFKEMKYAYEVLSDPNQRRIYDDYGPEIVQFGQGSMASPTEIWKALGRVGKSARMAALAVLVSTSFVVLSPEILVSLKWDGTISWHWCFVFLPLWIFQFAGLSAFFWFFDAQPPPGDEADWEEEARKMYIERKRTSKTRRLAAALVVALIALLELFVALRLQKTVQWSWFVVLLPWGVLESIVFATNISAARELWDVINEGIAEADRPSYASFLWGYLGLGVIRFLTIVLLAARADGLFVGSWFLCILPAMIYGTHSVTSACWSESRRRRSNTQDNASAESSRQEQGEQQGEEEESNGTEWHAGGICCSFCFWLTMGCVAASKLDGSHHSAFLIFLPLFIPVCCITCGVASVVVFLTPQFVESFTASQQAEERSNLNQSSDSRAYGSAGNPP
eukprot:TRINITY_DN57612_c0_g1_i1.p1 TRINITY_DN57612_c0_g1~~TRINITY_DN57612_c0_g1_i1.p1  ORF type:complete len:436 (-),score=53.95 TRINITY_DN57612_c0_g1_i1:49-1356(-)